MNREIEVKILEVDANALVKKLEGMGAQKTFDGEIDARYYDFPDRRVRNGHGLLRLRRKGNTAELVYKKTESRTAAKIEHEQEVTVSDFDTADCILRLLGADTYAAQKKRRASYAIDGCLVEFDTLPGLPTYIEIESPSEDKLWKTVERLGFSRKQALPWTQRQVLAHYGKTPDLK